MNRISKLFLMSLMSLLAGTISSLALAQRRSVPPDPFAELVRQLDARAREVQQERQICSFIEWRRVFDLRSGSEVDATDWMDRASSMFDQNPASSGMVVGADYVSVRGRRFDLSNYASASFINLFNLRGDSTELFIVLGVHRERNESSNRYLVRSIVTYELTQVRFDDIRISGFSCPK